MMGGLIRKLLRSKTPREPHRLMGGTDWMLDLLDKWNAVAAGEDLPIAHKLTPWRAGRLEELARELGQDRLVAEVSEAIDRIGGGTHVKTLGAFSPIAITFDWLIRADGRGDYRPRFSRINAGEWAGEPPGVPAKSKLRRKQPRLPAVPEGEGAPRP